MATDDTAPDGRAARTPSQQRSRERVGRMLEAATELIGEQGSDSLRMSEVASRAGVSIGSLYQFFPDKTALIGQLAAEITRESRACIAHELQGVSNARELDRAFSALIDTYYALFLERPVMRDIWSATQADPRLRAQEFADSRETADLLLQALLRIRPDLDKAKATSAARLMMHTGEATMRLAVSVDAREGRDLIEALKRMALGVFADLLGRRSGS